MDTIQTIESAATTVVAVAERDFHSIADRLKAIGVHVLAAVENPFLPHTLREALPSLVEVVIDLAQEVAELRVPCPCKPAPTSASTVEAGDAAPPEPADDTYSPGGDFTVISNAEAADFRAWKQAKADASAFAGSHLG